MQKSNYDYDVIIVGGGVSGCSCAWNCARLGLKTLLIEKNSYLGGAITSQLVIPAMKTDHKNLNTRFFEELCKNSNIQNAQITYIDGNPGWFNPFKLHLILHNMLTSVGCNVLLNSKIKDCASNKSIETIHNDKSVGEKKVLSLCIETSYNDNVVKDNCIDKKYNHNIGADKNNVKNNFSAKYFIDATGDANLCELVDANFLPSESNQALSLRFIMDKVDVKAFGAWVLDYDDNRNVTTGAFIDGQMHLSTACTWDLGQNWALAPLFENAVENGDLKDTDRAYFQIFSIAGEDDKIAFNCPRIMTLKPLNPLDVNDKIYAKKLGVEVIERLALFCNKYLIGFENAKIYKIADELGVRESRRVKGKYILTKEDIYEAKMFEHPVAYSNYPIDIHSIQKDNSVLNYVQKTYSIPLESLIVEGFENLFVIGRCLSADFQAQAAVRIQPTCFSMGEGLAKHISLL